MPRPSTLRLTGAMIGVTVAVGGVAAFHHRPASRETICAPGYSASIRPSEAVSHELKLRLLAERGLLPSDAQFWELDHVQPLCLNGAPTDPANLQLQRWPDARAKDECEAAACRAYCEGKLTLEQARASFRHD